MSKFNEYLDKTSINEGFNLFGPSSGKKELYCLLTPLGAGLYDIRIFINGTVYKQGKFDEDDAGTIERAIDLIASRIEEK